MQNNEAIKKDQRFDMPCDQRFAIPKPGLNYRWAKVCPVCGYDISTKLKMSLIQDFVMLRPGEEAKVTAQCDCGRTVVALLGVDSIIYEVAASDVKWKNRHERAVQELKDAISKRDFVLPR